MWSFIADAKRYGRKNGPVDANIIREELAIDHELSPEVKALLGNDPRAVEAMAALANFDAPGPVPEHMLENSRYLKSLVPAGRAHRYEVDIEADPRRLLDWDKPLRQQPEIVEPLIERFGGRQRVIDKQNEYSDAAQYWLNNHTPEAEAAWQTLNKDPAVRLGGIVQNIDKPPNQFGSDIGSRVTGNVLYQGLSQSRLGRRGASDLLKEQGVPGIKFWDGLSRAEGKGTSNFVVFDPKIIQIVRRYGISGAVASGLISQQMADQLRAQGYPEKASKGGT
jgi:hypothetical protein